MLCKFIYNVQIKKNINRIERQFNNSMRKARIAVEWTFSKIVKEFAFLNFDKNLKIYLQPVGMYYLVAGILTNCHTCLYGSQTSKYFNCCPPNLEEYLVKTN